MSSTSVPWVWGVGKLPARQRLTIFSHQTALTDLPAFDVRPLVAFDIQRDSSKSREQDDGLDTSLLKINNLVAECQSELLALELTRDIGTREGPVEDGDGASEHTLHGLAGEALGVLRPLNGDGARAADIGNDDGRTNVTRAVALYLTVWGESETVGLFTEVLNHVVALGFTVDE